MSESLITFHFSPYKTGQILRQYAKDRGISQAAMAARIGLSYDTVGNIYAGKVQKIPFEYMFKMCVALAIPIEVIQMLMLKDEDIDFEDQVLLYEPTKDKSIPAVDAVPSLIPSEVPDAVADTAVAVAAAAPAIAAAAASAPDMSRTYFTSDDIQIAVSRAQADHSAHVQDLKSQFDRERDAAAKHNERLHEITMAVLALFDKR